MPLGSASRLFLACSSTRWLSSLVYRVLKSDNCLEALVMDLVKAAKVSSAVYGDRVSKQGMPIGRRRSLGG